MRVCVSVCTRHCDPVDARARPKRSFACGLAIGVKVQKCKRVVVCCVSLIVRADRHKASHSKKERQCQRQTCSYSNSISCVCKPITITTQQRSTLTFWVAMVDACAFQVSYTTGAASSRVCDGWMYAARARVCRAAHFT